MDLIKLAWRNLGRNRRRSLITGAALCVGISLCVASYGLIDGLNAQLLDALTRLDLGHAQIHSQKYSEQKKLEHTLDHRKDLVAWAEARPGVVAATPRAYGYGLASAGNKSTGVELVGVDPAREPRVTKLHQQLQRGSYLDEVATNWPRGRRLNEHEQRMDSSLTRAAEEEALAELDELEPLEPSAADTPAAPSSVKPKRAPASANRSRAARLTRELAQTLSPPPERPPRVFIGASLAKNLKLEPAKKLVLTVQTVDGLSESVVVQVAGIFETGTPSYDRLRIYLHLADLQRLLHLHEPHEIAILTASPKKAREVVSELSQQLAAPALRVRSWDQIRPDIAQLLQINSVSTGLMVFIIFVVATLGVVNTMLMAVFERTRELGVLKAIGMSARRIVALIVTETLLLVLVASLAGTLLGLGLDAYMIVYGLDFSGWTEGISFGGIGVRPVIYGAITAEGLITPTAVLATCCLLASLYPALRAARLKPAIGMRET